MARQFLTSRRSVPSLPFASLPFPFSSLPSPSLPSPSLPSPSRLFPTLLSPLLLILAIGCGSPPHTGGDAGSDGGSKSDGSSKSDGGRGGSSGTDGGGSGDSASDSEAGPPQGDGGGDADAAGDAGSNTCTMDVDMALAANGMCQRCWPAWRTQCLDGNAEVVEGLVTCLLTGSCWDIGDPNTAVPCMQKVVNAHETPQLMMVTSALTAVGCSGDNLVEAEAIAAMMSTSNQAAFASCVGKVSGTGCPSTPLNDCLEAIIDVNHLCKN